MKKELLLLLFLFSFLAIPANSKTLEEWAKSFEPSALTYEERVQELKWFQEVGKELAKKLKGKTIRSAAEHIKTHYYERDVLSEMFFDITGIKVSHNIIGEGNVVKEIMTQLRTGRVIEHIYVNDADLIGTHLRYQGVVNLTEYMKGEGKKYTNPYIDLNDWLNLEFGQDYHGNQLQLPDQQFSNLYWFRYDWFNDPKNKTDFKERYGYELGVPINWAAYENIAEFFTGRTLTNPDGSTVKAYGHLDYLKPSPSLGWRFTDAWLSIAGVGDKGLPNGLPVDEWGIRVENKVPVGSMVERGGAMNSPAAVYALSKFMEWLRFAPPEAKDLEWHTAGPRAAKGDIAQRIFQYITWLSTDAFHKQGSPLVGKDGYPVWRVAPTPHGRYWDEGMKVGYQDAGSWTIPRSVRDTYRAAAWLWAQFASSKTVSLKKFLVGGTPVRKSTINHPYIDKNIRKWAGLIEFYRSPAEIKWTDSGPNVPDYALSVTWVANLEEALKKFHKGATIPELAQETMDKIAHDQDEMMASLKLVKFSPKMNPIRSKDYWLNQPGSPKPKRKPEKPQTINYDDLIKQWK
ncbi:ABC transporter substrate-binding protein [Candidatus Magnetomorum sp. HK-1]|nr:ABC transporter substrate-binding protein [Candidatus Magnetomorum sp. HK-1]